jgi:hypothetical protein
LEHSIRCMSNVNVVPKQVRKILSDGNKNNFFILGGCL